MFHCEVDVGLCSSEPPGTVQKESTSTWVAGVNRHYLVKAKPLVLDDRLVFETGRLITCLTRLPSVFFVYFSSLLPMFLPPLFAFTGGRRQQLRGHQDGRRAR